MVRFQLPQLRTEVIRLDEDTVLKTVGGATAWGFESLDFRSQHTGSSSNPGAPGLGTPKIRVQFPVGPLKYMVLWPSGEGSSLTKRRSGVRVPPGLLVDEWYGTQTGKAAKLKPS